MNSPHEIQAPSAWVARWAPLVQAGGTVLDLASGFGRHARHFAALGHTVLAVDRDADALVTLRGFERVETRVADLEGAPWPFSPGQFAAVIVVNYLHRPLLAQLIESLDAGGVLIYETFMVGNERYGKPSNPAFLLRPDELLEAVRGHLTVVAFEQGAVQAPKPAVVQRICAVRAADLQAIASC
jgi:SAM-dependent methyltransferase